MFDDVRSNSEKHFGRSPDVYKDVVTDTLSLISTLVKEWSRLDTENLISINKNQVDEVASKNGFDLEVYRRIIVRLAIDVLGSNDVGFLRMTGSPKEENYTLTPKYLSESLHAQYGTRLMVIGPDKNSLMSFADDSDDVVILTSDCDDAVWREAYIIDTLNNVGLLLTTPNSIPDTLWFIPDGVNAVLMPGFPEGEQKEKAATIVANLRNMGPSL